MPLSLYMKGRWLGGLFGAAAYPSIPANLYYSMSTVAWATAASDAAITAGEPVIGTGGFARAAVANNGTNFAAISVGATVGSASSTNLQAGPGPTGVLSFPASTGSGWSTAGNFLVTATIYDAATAGNLLWVGTPVNGSGVALSIAVNQAGITLYYAANGFTTLLL